MKVYRGTRTANGGYAVVVEEDGAAGELDPRFDLRTHSPAGVSWGFGGSGPAQLALALAADTLGDDDRARAVSQRLKFRLVGRLPADGWALTESQVREVIDRVEREAGGDRSPG